MMERIIDRASRGEIDIRRSGSCQWSEWWSDRASAEGTGVAGLTRRAPPTGCCPPHPLGPAMKLRYLLPAGLSLALVAAGAAAAGAAVTPAAATTITVGSGSGATLTDQFTGFSFEANILAGTAPSTGNLYQYMKTLGGGVMRFGGNFVDTTFWTSKGEARPSWAVATLAPSDLQRLKTLADNSGWKVILGVTLKQRDPARAADEAKFAKQILGSSLQAIEIGNEPNYYPNYSSAQYYSDFEAYKRAILAAAPGVGLVGPSVGRVPAADSWLTDFAD